MARKNNGKANLNNYRHGYQGQFAERDDETKYSSFELRQLDARMARWMSTDPYYQHHSPYMAMGNNPVSGIDPDGGFFFASAASSTLGCAAGSAAAGGLMANILAGGVVAAMTSNFTSSISTSGLSNQVAGAGQQHAGGNPPSNENIYDTRDIDFRYDQLAYIPEEGGGIHGSYHVSGSVTFSQNGNGTTAKVTATGETGVGGLGEITFGGTATLVVDGKVVSSRSFELPSSYIYEQGTFPMGSASFNLPSIGRSVQIRIKVGYSLKTSSGRTVPTPATLTRSINIPVLNSNRAIIRSKD